MLRAGPRKNMLYHALATREQPVLKGCNAIPGGTKQSLGRQIDKVANRSWFTQLIGVVYIYYILESESANPGYDFLPMFCRCPPIPLSPAYLYVNLVMHGWPFKGRAARSYTARSRTAHCASYNLFHVLESVWPRIQYLNSTWSYMLHWTALYS